MIVILYGFYSLLRVVQNHHYWDLLIWNHLLVFVVWKLVMMKTQVIQLVSTHVSFYSVERACYLIILS